MSSSERVRISLDHDMIRKTRCATAETKGGIVLKRWDSPFPTIRAYLWLAWRRLSRRGGRVNPNGGE